MSLKYTAALAYVNSLVDNLPITDDARDTIRGFLPKKDHVEEGFLVQDYDVLVERLAQNDYWELLCLDEISEEYTHADILADPELLGSVYLGDAAEIRGVRYVWTPTGLGHPADTYYKFPISNQLLEKLVLDRVIETRILLM